MDRDEASRALELLRSVVSQARDDTALQNWGIIWILHGVTNGAAFVATNLLLWRGHLDHFPYVALWAAVITLNIGAIFVLKTRRTGARSFIENQIWAIWLTFIGAVVLTDFVNILLHLPVLTLGPIMAVLSAVGFSSMGAIMGRRWFLGTALFAATAVAMALKPAWQFVILGAVWGAAQLTGGIWLELEKRQRLAAGARPPRLV
jgi:hypothetical protein